VTGDVNRVRCLMDQGVSSQYAYDFGATPLHIAAMHGRHEVAEILLVAGADAGALASKGGFMLTPNGIAEMHNHRHVVNSISRATHNSMREVRLNIYDVGSSTVQKVNTVFRAMGVGAFHAAVEVYGQEWSFGYRPDGGSGIFCSRPRQCDLHIYRESVVMGSTLLSELKVHEIMKRMAKEWPGGNYDVLQRNCCHFSEEFCAKLGVGPLPLWVNNLAATLENGVRSAAGVAEAAAVAACKACELDRHFGVSESVVTSARYLSDELDQRLGGHFEHPVEDICAKLGVGPLPPWANNFAASVERGVRSAAGAAEAFVGGRSTWTCTSNTAAHSFSFSGDDEDIGNALTRLWRRVQTASRTRSAGVPHVESRCTRD